MCTIAFEHMREAQKKYLLQYYLFVIQVNKITERFGENGKGIKDDGFGGVTEDEDDLGDPDDLESDWTPGRILDTRRVLERVFDLDGN